MLKALKKEHLVPIFFFILSLFLFAWKIGSIPIIDGDSAFYAEIAKNIVRNGDWMTLRYIDPANIIDKPPLMFWMIAICFKIFGINEFALAIWHSLLAASTVLVTYYISKELFNAKTAFLSTAILITTAQFFYQGRVPLQDIPLTLFIALAVYCFLLFDKYKNRPGLYLAAVFTALATLTKGPVGLALVGLIILSYVILNKKWASYSKIDYLARIPLAIILFFAITLPWFIMEYQKWGQPFLEVFWGRNFGRFLMPVDTVGATAVTDSIKPQYDFYSYFLQLLLLLIPWGAFVYPALYHAFKRLKNQAEKSSLLLLFCWALIPLIFFSISLNYKIARYILPALPALAIIIGKFWNDYLENKKELARPMLVSNLLNLLLILPALILLTAIAIFKFPNEQAAFQPIVFPFLSILSLGMLAATLLLLRKKGYPAFQTFFTSALIAYIVLIGCFAVYFQEANPTRYFSQKILSIFKPNEVVGQYTGTGTAMLNFYTDHHAALINGEENLAGFLKQPQKTYVLTDNPKALEEFEKKYPGKAKTIEKKSYMILFTN
ncbi:MAG: glycosyltransferase family 39 protein [Candidatus Saganbacteria bacterium]|nr:glycosyltransferase family 39 protein [Candidatus Saganbacteria bacterium]